MTYSYPLFLLLLFLSIFSPSNCAEPITSLTRPLSEIPWLRSISETVKIPSELIAFIGISHFSTTLGFIGKFEYFFSLGYGLSTALLGVIGPTLMQAELSNLSIAHSAGVALYGLRLKTFLFWRSGQPTFQNHRKQMYAKTGGPKSPPFVVKFSVWVMVSSLYVLLYMPCYSIMKEGLSPNVFGLGIMYLGLAVESISDSQKSEFKIKCPDHFVNRGLFRFSRHINYFGEILMWIGVWLGGFPAYRTQFSWLVNSIGPLFMLYLMVSVTKSLDRRQNEKYSELQGYKEYTYKTPILVPFIPLYGF